MSFEQEYIGKFNFPEHEDKAVHGVLEINRDESAKLVLSGGFFTTRDEFENQPSSGRTIHGLLDNGKKITLFQCYAINFSHGQGNTISNIYIVNGYVMGLHEKSLDDFSFKIYRFSCSNFDIWLNRSGIVEELLNEYNKSRFVDHRIFTTDISNDTTIKLITVPKISLQFDDNKFLLEIQSFVEFHFSHPVNYPDFYLKQQIFKFFLELATGEKQYITSNCVVSNRQSYRFKFGKSNNNLATNISRHRMLFIFQDIVENWNDILKKWFELYEQYKDAFDWYFATGLSINSTLEQKFLHLTQFLESFHRRKIPPDKNKMERRKNIINRVRKQILPKNKDNEFLHSKLDYAHEDSFKERIVDLLNKCTINISGLLGMTNAKFGKKIKMTRNFYTHLLESGRPNVMSSEELFKIMPKLQILARYLMLMELPFNENKRSNIISSL